MTEILNVLESFHRKPVWFCVYECTYAHSSVCISQLSIYVSWGCRGEQIFAFVQSRCKSLHLQFQFQNNLTLRSGSLFFHLGFLLTHVNYIITWCLVMT